MCNILSEIIETNTLKYQKRIKRLEYVINRSYNTVNSLHLQNYYISVKGHTAIWFPVLKVMNVGIIDLLTAALGVRLLARP